MLTVLLLLGIVVGAFAISYIGVLVWIWRDAERWGEDSMGWVIAASYLGLFVIPLYKGSRGLNKVACDGCGRMYLRGGLFCPHCGKESSTNG